LDCRYAGQRQRGGPQFRSMRERNGTHKNYRAANRRGGGRRWTRPLPSVQIRRLFTSESSLSQNGRPHSGVTAPYERPSSVRNVTKLGRRVYSLSRRGKAMNERELNGNCSSRRRDGGT